jgi:anti-sigma28 factor (negative regulator of flagellin synthesis)
VNNIEQVTPSNQSSFTPEVINKTKAKRSDRKTTKSAGPRGNHELAPHIAILKEKIEKGAYSIDYDELASRILLYEL